MNIDELIYIFLSWISRRHPVPDTSRFYNPSAVWCNKDEVCLYLGMSPSKVQRTISSSPMFYKPKRTTSSVVYLNPAYKHLLDNEIDFEAEAIERRKFMDDWHRYSQRVFEYLLDNPYESSICRISRATGIHLLAVKDSLNTLKNLGFLTVTKKEGSRSRQECNEFMLHLDEVYHADCKKSFEAEKAHLVEMRKARFAIARLNLCRKSILSSITPDMSREDKAELFSRAKKLAFEIKRIKGSMPNTWMVSFMGSDMSKLYDFSISVDEGCARKTLVVLKRIARIKSGLCKAIDKFKGGMFLHKDSYCMGFDGELDYWSNKHESLYEPIADCCRPVFLYGPA